MYKDDSQNLKQLVHFNLRYYRAFQGWLELEEQKKKKKADEEARRSHKAAQMAAGAPDGPPPPPPTDKFKDGPYIFMPDRTD